MQYNAYFLLELWRKLEGFEQFGLLVFESPVLVSRGSLEEVGVSHFDKMWSGRAVQAELAFDIEVW